MRRCDAFARLEASAAGTPDRVAIEFQGRAISFGALHEGALALAGYLQQHFDVRHGGRVLLLMPECAQHAIACYAVLRCGAVGVAADPMSSADAVAGCAAEAGARLAITTQDLLPRLQPLRARGALDGIVVGAASDRAAFERAPREPGLHGFADALAAGIAPRPAVIGYGECSACCGCCSHGNTPLDPEHRRRRA